MEKSRYWIRKKNEGTVCGYSHCTWWLALVLCNRFIWPFWGCRFTWANRNFSLYDAFLSKISISAHTHTHKTQLRKKGIRKMKLEFCARNEFVTFRFLSERSALCKFYLWFHSVSIVSSISRLRACFFVPLVWWIAWNARISLEINSNKGEMPQHLRQNETKSTNRKICILHELRTVIRTLCIHMHNDL